MGIQNKVL